MIDMHALIDTLIEDLCYPTLPYHFVACGMRTGEGNNTAPSDPAKHVFCDVAKHLFKMLYQLWNFLPRFNFLLKKLSREFITFLLPAP